MDGLGTVSWANRGGGCVASMCLTEMAVCPVRVPKPGGGVMIPDTIIVWEVVRIAPPAAIKGAARRFRYVVTTPSRSSRFLIGLRGLGPSCAPGEDV